MSFHVAEIYKKITVLYYILEDISKCTMFICYIALVQHEKRRKYIVKFSSNKTLCVNSSDMLTVQKTKEGKGRDET